MKTLVFMQLNFVWWSVLFDNGCYFSQQLYSSLVCSPLTVVWSKLISCSYAWLEVGMSAEKHCCLIWEIAKHCKVTFGDWLQKEGSIYSLKKKGKWEKCWSVSQNITKFTEFVAFKVWSRSRSTYIERSEQRFMQLKREVYRACSEGLKWNPDCKYRVYFKCEDD